MSIMDYLHSWDMFFYVMWLSIALGFGLAVGVFMFFGACALVDKITNLKFKKEK